MNLRPLQNSIIQAFFPYCIQMVSVCDTCNGTTGRPTQFAWYRGKCFCISPSRARTLSRINEDKSMLVWSAGCEISESLPRDGTRSQWYGSTNRTPQLSNFSISASYWFGLLYPQVWLESVAVIKHSNILQYILLSRIAGASSYAISFCFMKNASI